MLYQKIIGSFVLTLSPKKARKFTLRLIKLICHIPLLRLIVKSPYHDPSLRRSYFGLDLKSPIGIGAGLDQDVRYFNELNSIGAAFTTVGPLSLHGDDSVCNVKNAIQRLKGTDDSDDRHVIAVLTRNKETLQDDIPLELDRAYTLIYDFADIVCIDMDGIRTDIIDEILDRLTTIRRFNDDHRAILVKLPVNMSEDDLDLIIHEVLSFGIDGVVIANGIHNHEMLAEIKKKSHDLLPIVVSGGSITPQSAREYIKEGAALLSLTDEIISGGPLYIKYLCKYIAKQPRTNPENENSINLHNRR